MRAFILVRDEDVTGVSGIGVVAVHWRVGTARSTSVWDSIEDAETIHGHDGLTRFEFADDIVWGPA